jgi:hypothetical protein
MDELGEERDRVYATAAAERLGSEGGGTARRVDYNRALLRVTTAEIVDRFGPPGARST